MKTYTPIWYMTIIFCLSACAMIQKSDILQASDIDSNTDISRSLHYVEPQVNSSSISVLKRVPQKLSHQALQNDIEGKVTIEFTVSSIGTVDNPVIVNSQPTGVFDTAALEAIKKFKFKPRIVNGLPIAQRARQTFIFKLYDPPITRKNSKKL